MKTEVSKLIFGHAVIFFPDFLFLQNLEFWAFEGPFQAKKQKDVKDDGDCPDFFPDFLLLQNLEFWAFEGPLQVKNKKMM